MTEASAREIAGDHLKDAIHWLRTERYEIEKQIQIVEDGLRALRGRTTQSKAAGSAKPAPSTPKRVMSEATKAKIRETVKRLWTPEARQRARERAIAAYAAKMHR